MYSRETVTEIRENVHCDTPVVVGLDGGALEVTWCPALEEWGWMQWYGWTDRQTKGWLVSLYMSQLS